MNILTKLKAISAALLIVIATLGVIITIAHLVEGRVVRRSITSFKLTEALFERASTVRLLFVERDATQIDKLKEVDGKITSLIAMVQKEFPVQHPAQATLADLSEAHTNVVGITDDALAAGVISVVSGERDDIVIKVSAISRGLVAGISEVNSVNAADLTRVVRLANLLLLVGLGVMVIIILSGTYMVYRAFARPLAEICTSLENGEYGIDTQVVAFDRGKGRGSEVAKIKAALKVLGKRAEINRQDRNLKS